MSLATLVRYLRDVELKNEQGEGDMLRFSKLTALCAAGSFLAGCGGGGSGGGTGAVEENPPPVLQTVTFSTKEGTPLTAQVTATDADGEALSFTVNRNPLHGELTRFDADGTFVYQPEAGLIGDDTFGVQVSDTGGNTISGTVTISVHANRPPVVASDLLRADGADLDAIDVLENDSDADADVLTVSIEEAPLVGTAVVNADSTVRITDLPTGFKGVTRFRYRVTDTSDASAVAAVAVFVGVDPFRVLFAGDAAGNGAVEVFINDFVSEPQPITTATEGNLRLRGFTAAANAATVLYRREDPAVANSSELFVVRPGVEDEPVRVPLPAGATVPQDAQGADQFVVSPDGDWIALVLRTGSTDAVYVARADDLASMENVMPAGAVSATSLRFSRDSRNLYFLASSVPGGANKTLYTVVPDDPVATVPVSAMSAPSTADDVMAYAVSPDQTRILLLANRSGRTALYFVDARELQTEVQVSHTLAFGESIQDSTLTLNGGTVGTPQLQRVLYTVRNLVGGLQTYVAEVSATPDPRVVASAAQAVGLRPDENALLYSKGLQIWESGIAADASGELVDAGSRAWYESTGNIILIQQFLASGGSPPSYPALAVAVRGSFGTTQRLGTPGLAQHHVDVSGFDRGVVVIGEGATTGAAPTSSRLALVNALAPQALFYLAPFNSPQGLTTPAVQVAAY